MNSDKTANAHPGVQRLFELRRASVSKLFDIAADSYFQLLARTFSFLLPAGEEGQVVCISSAAEDLTAASPCMSARLNGIDCLLKVMDLERQYDELALLRQEACATLYKAATLGSLKQASVTL